MKAELAARLRKAMLGGTAEKAVVPVDPVVRNNKPNNTNQLMYNKNNKNNIILQASQDRENPVVPFLSPADQDAIIERAALCAESIPPIYLDAWARLNHQKTLRVSDSEWRQALDDGGRFLDAWGAWAAEWGWTIAEIFDPPRRPGEGGLIWRLDGAIVEAFGPDHARLSDGRQIFRKTDDQRRATP